MKLRNKDEITCPAIRYSENIKNLDTRRGKTLVVAQHCNANAIKGEII